MFVELRMENGGDALGTWDGGELARPERVLGTEVNYRGSRPSLGRHVVMGP